MVEWSIFVLGVILMHRRRLVGALPGPGGIFVFAPRPRLGPEDQHVGQAPLRALQALAAEGRPLDRLGRSAAERQAARGIRKQREQSRRDEASCRRQTAADDELTCALTLRPPLIGALDSGRLFGGPFSFDI